MLRRMRKFRVVTLCRSKGGVIPPSQYRIRLMLVGQNQGWKQKKEPMGWEAGLWAH